ncbi:MAG TPA: hypothetical protein VF759_14405 [Allosphingosinicella sp.]|jgi:hypothetical protein
MDGLNEYAPAIGGAAFLAYLSHFYFRIRREQARAREQRGGAK